LVIHESVVERELPHSPELLSLCALSLKIASILELELCADHRVSRQVRTNAGYPKEIQEGHGLASSYLRDPNGVDERCAPCSCERGGGGLRADGRVVSEPTSL